MTESKREMRVSKRCPNCGWRVLDKITPTAGIIELKCPKCDKPVMIDLSYRTSHPGTLIQYRVVRSC